MTQLLPRLLGSSLLLACAPAANAQLSGVHSICPTCTTAGNYTSFGDAVRALNANGAVAAGVTFVVLPGALFDEIVPSITVSGSATGPIVFQRGSGPAANPKIQGTGTGSTDAAVTLDGADYVQFTGIDVEDKATNTTAAQQLEYGFLLQNGATHNTLSGGTIALNRANTTRTAGVALLNGGNDQNHFYGLTVQNCAYGYDLEGTTALYDDGTEIGPLPNAVGPTPASALLDIGVPPVGTAGGIAFSTYGIYLKSQTNANIFKTEINGLTGTTSVYGIYSTGTNNSVNVTECRVHGMSSTGTTGIAMGMYVNSGTTHRFLRNYTYDIEAVGTSGFVAGFDITAGTTNYLVNNMVYDVRALASNAGTSVRAFSFRGGNNYAYHNTVVVGYTATNPANKSAALYMSGSPTVDLRNNVFVNIVGGLPAGGGGVAAAFFKNNNVMTSVSIGSNNNIYYGGNPSGEHLIFYGAAVGTSPAALDQTLAQYKARVATVEQASLTELPPFRNATTNPHLFFTVPTLVESNGQSLASTPLPVATDIDLRNRNISRPDIGAEENGFTPLAARTSSNMTVAAQVVPNPARLGAGIGLHLSGPACLLHLTISDAMGREVMLAPAISHAAGLEIAPLRLPATVAPGWYVLRVRDAGTGTTVSQKLLLE